MSVQTDLPNPTPAQVEQRRRFQAAGVARQKGAKAQREAAGVLRTGQRDANGVEVLSRSEELERGIISVRDLSDEELAYRKCYNASQTFTGVAYAHSPKVYAAMDAELLERGARLIRGGYTKAIVRLLGMLDSGDGNLAIRAIDRVMERVSGKVPDKLLSADVTPFAEAHSEIAAELARALGYDVPAANATPAADPGATIIEGEVVSDDQGPKPAAATKQKRSRATKSSNPKRKRTSKQQSRPRAARPGSEPIDISKYL